MPYKALEIYKDLPQSNCGECGKPGCFQFGLAVYLNEMQLEDCPQLEGEHLEQMKGKLAEGRDAGEGKAAPNHQQALERLYEIMADADMEQMAELAGSIYKAGDPESIELDLFGNIFTVERKAVHPPAGREENVWEKALLLLYLTMSKGKKAEGRWVAYRELPNTISKAKDFEDECERLARACTIEPEELDRVATALGGTILEAESADRAYEFQALPRVKLRWIFWAGDEDFPPRCSILMDKGILDYLDQEATVFMAEVFVNSIIDAIDKE